MALPQAETGVIELVREAEAAEARQEALANHTHHHGHAPTEEAAPAQIGAALEGVARPADGVLVTINEAHTEVAHATEAFDPMALLAKQGITDIKINFSSFPMVTLKEAMFSTPDHKRFADKFEFIFMEQRKVYLLRGEMKVRDAEAQLAYSDDGIHQNETMIPLAEVKAEWDANDAIANVDLKIYTVLVGRITSGVLAKQIVQLQVPETSKPRWDGYAWALARDGVMVTDVITEVSAGAEIGKGTRKFNPWVFKKIDV